VLTEVQITRVGLLGQGVGYDEQGNTYFVPGLVPGDIAQVEAPLTHKRYREAKLIHLLQASSERQPVACPYFGRCGGCDWLHWKYENQLKTKESALAYALQRAGSSPKEFLPICGAKETLGYRNRVQLKRHGNQIGFYQKGSHDLIDIQKCEVAHPKINAALAQLRKIKSTKPSQEKIELVLQDDGKVECLEDAPHAASGFIQANPSQNRVLKALVTDQVKRAGAERVLELFCGNGNFTFDYLPLVKEAVGIDSHPQVLERANQKKEALKTSHVNFS